MSLTPDPDLRRAIVLLSSAAFASSVSARVCDPMLPELARAFSAAPARVALVVSGFSVSYGLVQAFFGPLGDRIGKYRLIALTTLACTLGTLAAALAPTLDALILARLFLGASAAGIIPLSMAWIGDRVAYQDRQATLARFLAGQILGVVGGQFVGGIFTDTVGWRWAFGFLCVLYLAVGLRVLGEARRNPLARHAAGTGAPPAGLAVQASILFRVGWARVVLTVVFLEGMLVFGGLALVPLFLHQRFELSMSMAGALAGTFGLGGLGYIFVSRSLVRRLGETGLAMTGALLIAAAWWMVALAPAWGYAVPACLLLGLGFYMIHNTLQTNATQMAPQVRGTAVSFFASAFFLGQSLGVSAGAALFHAAGPTALFATAGTAILPLGMVFAALLRARHRSL
ncbi:MAG: MFS transporter [Rhodocyclaceae bacterium]|nr:MFS transporter [Rhodocyclaceae bacterium]